MCGIAGYIGKQGPSQEQILTTLNRMKNRGPDRQDCRVFTQGDTRIVLLHSRLSIIDLDARANQPFTIGDYTIIFNGEIYNYLELRSRLEARGASFRTSSDTEVLLQSYIEKGEECVQEFEGMWAFAIYNAHRGELFISRDRFAEKPLFYFEDGSGLYFGSETRFLKTLSGRRFNVNRRQLERYLAYGYKSLYKGRDTFFTGVQELPYASNLSIAAGAPPRLRRYWRPALRSAPQMSREEAVAGAQHHLRESLRIRLRADVPTAFCLSGGVDSAVLVSMAAKIFNCRVSSFSIVDQDERYDESRNIMATVEDVGCQSTLITLSRENFLPRLTELIRYHDSPIATISYYIHSLLAEAISAHGCRVAFAGTGADELFTGYYDHFLLHLQALHAHADYPQYLADWQQHIAPCVRNPILKDPELYYRDPHYREHIYDNSGEFAGFLKSKLREDFVEETFCGRLLRNRMLNELFHEVVPVILHEDDLNCMYYSIENRSPFLDSNLLDFMASVPEQHLIHNGFGKYILREAAAGILNDQVRCDRRKRGFNASINSMVDFEDAAIRDYLLNPRAPIFDLIERDSVCGLLAFKPAPNHYSKFLFNFINAKIFLEMAGD